MDQTVKIVLISLIVAGLLVAANNRYRLPLIGLTQAELEQMAKEAERRRAASGATEPQVV